MNFKIVMIAFLLSALTATAGYLPTDVTLKTTKARLSVTGLQEFGSSLTYSGVMLSTGGKLFAIDAKSNKAVLTYLGQILCSDLSLKLKKKVRFTGYLAYGYGPNPNGTVLLTTQNGKMFAELTPNREMVVGLNCSP
jgi:hypothetical protein